MSNIEQICERLSKLEEHIEYHTKLLESIVEAIPPASKQPDVLKAMEPLLNSPMIKDNPALATMLESFKKNMGGK